MTKLNRTRFPEVAGPVEAPEARAAWEAMAPEDREAVVLYVRPVRGS